MKVPEFFKEPINQIFSALIFVLIVLVLFPMYQMLKPDHVMSAREIVESVQRCQEAQLPLEINRNFITNEITSIQCKPE